MIYFAYNVKKASIYKIKCRKLIFVDIDFSNLSSFIFKANHVFIENQDNPSEKVVTDEEKLDGIDIDGIGNLEDLPRIVFISAGILSYSLMEESLNQRLYKSVDVHFMTYVIDESVSSISMRNILN